MSEKADRDNTLAAQIIEKLAEAESSPTEIAAEVEVDLSELVAIASVDANLEMLRQLARLSDVRAQMLLSKYRANAAVQLIAIASAEEPTELSRKACVDLLKADLDAFGEVSSSVAQPVNPPAPNEASILRALESLGVE